MFVVDGVVVISGVAGVVAFAVDIVIVVVVVAVVVVVVVCILYTSVVFLHTHACNIKEESC